MPSFYPLEDVSEAVLDTAGVLLLHSDLSLVESWDKLLYVHAVCVPVCLFQESFQSSLYSLTEF